MPPVFTESCGGWTLALRLASRLPRVHKSCVLACMFLPNSIEIEFFIVQSSDILTGSINNA